MVRSLAYLVSEQIFPRLLLSEAQGRCGVQVRQQAHITRHQLQTTVRRLQLSLIHINVEKFRHLLRNI